MKIKTDFVTNSSSTLFIVCIPDDFETTPEEILKRCPSLGSEFENYIKSGIVDEKWKGKFEEFMLEAVPDHIEELKMENNLWTYGWDGTLPDIYDVIVDLLTDNGHILHVMDVSGEGNNQIQAVPYEKLKTFFIAESLKDIEVKGVCSDVTES